MKENKGYSKAAILLLLASAFLIATAGLAYELVAGTASSYLLGDSVTQFSRTIGVYLSAMGLGSYLSRFIIKDVLQRFIELELAVALIGGFSATIFMLGFAHLSYFPVLVYGLLLITGGLVGIEIPLLLRILKEKISFRELIARVLALDYLGGLAAALAFPVLLAMPEIGLIRSSLLFGLANALVALVTIVLFRTQLPLRRFLVKFLLVFTALLCGLTQAEKIEKLSEAGLYADQVIFSRQTRYQKLTVTRFHDQFSLFINNNLQFNSFDEYRYHEALVHPAMETLHRSSTAALKILVLGGGDGLAIREILKYPRVSKIVLIDLDPEMTELATSQPWLAQLNRGALSDERVIIVNQDAFTYLQQESNELYHAVFLDFPDPNNFSLGKLYSTTFYRTLRPHLARGALAVTQATSPLAARRSFWCIDATLRQSQFQTAPYHVYVPSFGEWGFIMFGDSLKPAADVLNGNSTLYLEKELRFARASQIPDWFQFPPDMAQVTMPPQTLDRQVLVRAYEEEWAAYQR